MKKQQKRLRIADLEIVYEAGATLIAVGLHECEKSRARCHQAMFQGFVFPRPASANTDLLLEAEVRAEIKKRWRQYWPGLRQSHARIEAMAKREQGQKTEPEGRPQ